MRLAEGVFGASAASPAPSPGLPDLHRFGRERPVQAARVALVVTTLAASGGLLGHSETPWSSITFSGARHTLTLRFAGESAIVAGEAFAAALPEHEFALAGLLVADAVVSATAWDMIARPMTMTLTVELLVLDDGDRF